MAIKGSGRPLKGKASKVGKAVRPAEIDAPNTNDRKDIATMKVETSGTRAPVQQLPTGSANTRKVSGSKVSGGARIRGGAPGKPVG